MPDLLEKIKRIGPEEAERLQQEGRQGNSESVVRFIQWSLWRKLEHDRFIPAAKKPDLFYLLNDICSIHVEFYSPTPAAPAPSTKVGGTDGG